MSEPPGGFTQEDRDRLITLLAKFDSFQVSSERRLEILEESRAQKNDLDRIEKELRYLIERKADKAELNTATTQRLELMVQSQAEAISQQGRKIAWAYAFGAGAAAASSAVVYVLMILFHHA